MLLCSSEWKATICVDVKSRLMSHPDAETLCAWNFQWWAVGFLAVVSGPEKRRIDGRLCAIISISRTQRGLRSWRASPIPAFSNVQFHRSSAGSRMGHTFLLVPIHSFERPAKIADEAVGIRPPLLGELVTGVCEEVLMGRFCYLAVLHTLPRQCFCADRRNRLPNSKTATSAVSIKSCLMDRIVA